MPLSPELTQKMHDTMRFLYEDEARVENPTIAMQAKAIPRGLNIAVMPGMVLIGMATLSANPTMPVLAIGLLCVEATGWALGLHAASRYFERKFDKIVDAKAQEAFKTGDMQKKYISHLVEAKKQLLPGTPGGEEEAQNIHAEVVQVLDTLNLKKSFQNSGSGAASLQRSKGPSSGLKPGLM